MVKCNYEVMKMVGFKEILNATPGDDFEKIISPNGQTITFRKNQRVSFQTQKMIVELFDENKELMERLKDE